jgi:NAD(P)-binding Rossmann-like domain
VGGLAIAARILGSSWLKKNNDENSVVHVTILEKNANVGGRCGSFLVPHPNDNNTLIFRHERGPSLLLLPQIYRELF